MILQFFIFSNLDIFPALRLKEKFLAFVIRIDMRFSIYGNNGTEPLLEFVYHLPSRYEVIDSEIVPHLLSNLCFRLY